MFYLPPACRESPPTGSVSWSINDFFLGHAQHKQQQARDETTPFPPGEAVLGEAFSRSRGAGYKGGEEVKSIVVFAGANLSRLCLVARNK